MVKDITDIEGDIFLSSNKEWAFSAIGSRRSKDGVPRQRYRKKLITVGEFVQTSDNISFGVKPETLTHWSETFARMKANGVDVRIPATHEGDGDSDKTRGIVEDIFVDGDALVMACDMIGEDGISGAARNDVSIGCPSEFIDGKGRKYVRPIQHVALTPNPVIPGLGAFEPIAASHKKTPKEKIMDLKALAKRVGLEVELTDENAVEELGKAFDANVALSRVSKVLGIESVDDIDKLGAAVKVSLDKKIELAKAKPEAKVVDPQLVVLSRKNCEHTLDDLVRGAKITPATKDKLAELYLSDDALNLSLSAGQSTTRFDNLCEILAGNDTVSLKAVTSGQVLKLDNPMDPKSNPMLRTCQERAKKTA